MKTPNGDEYVDPLDNGPILGKTPTGQVKYNPEALDKGRIQPIINPAVGDFLTLPPGTEVVFYSDRPGPGVPGLYVAIVTQEALDEWKDMDPSLPMGWAMILYLLPGEGPF